MIFFLRQTVIFIFWVVGLLGVGCGNVYSDSSFVSMGGFISQLGSDDQYVFKINSRIVDAEGISREVAAFNVDGLLQYALILRPAGAAPDQGWPLVMFNHGFHPDSANYGRIDGSNARPGAYYWDSAQAYAKRGYVVVVPDYRGHNDSKVQYFSSMERLLNWYSLKMHGIYKHAYWYTRDAIAAYLAAVKLDGINTNKVYMVGHSMGGGITQRSILALGSQIKAASIWSTSGGHVELESYWHELEVPLLIQHGEGDQSTREKDSRALAAILSRWQKEHHLIIVDTKEHLFVGEDFERAIQRDIDWFASHP